jgi:hypothetical protein
LWKLGENEVTKVRTLKSNGDIGRQKGKGKGGEKRRNKKR